MNTAPFLTRLDPKLAIKGSRDALGFIPIWSRFGREIVGNLSTITNSARQFTTLILGAYFARQLINHHVAEEDAFLDIFLKFEQVAAYSRYAWRQETGSREGDIRGIRLVSRKFQEGQGCVTIATNQTGQILSNQKQYGVWGFFSAPSRDSGLLNRDDLGPTPQTVERIEDLYLPPLQANHVLDELQHILVNGHDRFEPLGKHKQLSWALATLLGPYFSQQEQDFYAGHLVFGEPNAHAGRQQQLWECFKVVNPPQAPWELSVSVFERIELQKAAAQQGWTALAERLDRIIRIERLLVPCHYAFQYLQSQHGQPLRRVGQAMGRLWPGGLSYLEDVERGDLLPEIGAAGSAEMAKRLDDLASAFHRGQYDDAIVLLLEQNEDVMNRRGGGPWIARKSDTLEVRFRSEQARPPALGDLRDTRLYSYFMDALKQVGYDVFYGPKEPCLDQAA